MSVRPPLIPCLAYKDAPAATDFLCSAFAFDRHAVDADDKDPSFIHHAQRGRNYSALDLEGYASSFGSYDPWAK
jgi:uncharacterized glyoxalase superfamily protein PhnB